MIRIDIVCMLSAQFFTRGVGRIARALWLRANRGVFAIRFVPYRDDLDALLGRLHDRRKLRFGLMCKPIADAERELFNDKSHKNTELSF